MRQFSAYLRAVALLMALLVMTACGGDGGAGGGDEPGDEPGASTQLAASPLSFEVAGAGGSFPITITSPAAWRISASSWCSVEPQTGVAGTTQATLKVSPNEGAARETTLILSASGKNEVVRIAVKQEKAAEVVLSSVTAEPDTWDGVHRGEMIYQLLIYSFADSNGDGVGDFRGIINKLDYIAELGASAIWLSPIHPADSYHGYDVTNYSAVNPQYGTMADFEALIKAAHERGIKIILDYVMNHTGKGHPWYKDACSSLSSDYRNWFCFSTTNTPTADFIRQNYPSIDPARVEGSWESSHTISAQTGPVRYKFSLDWSNSAAPKITVTETTEALTGDGQDPTVNRFIYFGDPGKNHRMHARGNNLYELVIDYASPWGFLVRTADGDDWGAGKKWGAPSKTTYITPGQPFTLNSSAAEDIKFAGSQSYYVYSACYTNWMPDLNYGSISNFKESGPYKAILASVKEWIDRGVDGLRLDMVKHIYSNPDNQDNPTFWKGFYDDVNAYYKSKGKTDDIFMVGEVLSEQSQVLNYTSCLSSCFNFSFWWHTMQSAVSSGTGRNIAKNLKALQDEQKAKNPYYIDGTKLSNHDEDRAASFWNGDTKRGRMGGVVIQTLPGRPFVYYGEELGYSGKKNDDNAGDEAVRQPMKWTQSDYASKGVYHLTSAFPSFLDVATATADPNSILNAYRQFGQLRNIYPALTERGTLTSYEELYQQYGTALNALAAYYREADGQKLLVLHNMGSQTLEFKLSDSIHKAVAVMGEVKSGTGATYTQLSMGGYSSVVYLLK